MSDGASGQLPGSFPSRRESTRLRAAACLDRGVALTRLHKPRAALASFDEALRIDPTLAAAHANRGVVLKGLRHYTAALASYDRAIALRPGSASAHANRADALIALRRFGEALASCDRAIEHEPGHAEAHLNRGAALRLLGRPEDALECFERAIALRPSFAEAHANRGAMLAQLERRQEALASYDRAIELKELFAEARFNRSVLRLQLGDFAGWADYEWRWRNENGRTFRERRAFARPLWLGECAVAGSRILLHAEQGLGDTLQFCRYVSEVAARGAEVVLEVQSPLVGVLSQLPGVKHLLIKGATLPPFDFHCPLLSLPLALATTLDSIPAAHGYLSSAAVELTRWQRRLAERRRPRVGLTWSGSPGNPHDRHRNVALAELLACLPDGIEYFCLQTQVRATDQATLAAHPEVRNFAEELTFSATAALCELMDLVISVDTSIAHLSGALGRPTWILLPRNADWRWLLDRADCPWYRSVRLYRQTRLDDWRSVLQRVAADLRNQIGGAT
jgi:Tfp pilus assembly protein PilF